jgi:hypothetical protein
VPPGSECCAVVGDGDCEAYTAIFWGVRLSFESHKIAEAEALQKREAIRRRDKGEESLAVIGRSYNVSGWTISRLTA